MSSVERYPIPQRRKLASDWEAVNWDLISPIYKELDDRKIRDVDELEEWLLDWSELESLIGAVASRRYRATVCDTADKEAEELHLLYQTKVLPEVAICSDRLSKKFLATPCREDLDTFKWEVFIRDAERAVALFREENVELDAQDQELSVEYGKISASMTVEFEGKTCTLQEMSAHQESTDRQLRETTWRLVSERRIQDRDKLDDLLDRMIALRCQLAENAGFENYRDYKHAAKHRFDYIPEDCLALHENVSKYVMPSLARISSRRCRLLQLDTLRPWDLGVDPEGLPPYKPFDGQQQQVEVAASILEKVDYEIAEDLRWMNSKEMLDLDTRPSKRPGGYMDDFGDVRWPFIFSNSSPTHAGIETLIHEAGHARHALLSRELEPGDYRESPLEFAEVASMGMEAMCMEHLSAAYPEAEARRAAINSMEGMLSTMAWTSTIDAFQHQVYLAPKMGHDERSKCWEETWSRFSTGIVDWTGLDAARATRWQSQLHIFEVPFYYIEYAIAQMGAMQLWSKYRKDPQTCVEEYAAGLRLGGSRPLPELFAAAGIEFDPRGECLASLVPEVEAAWGELTGEDG